MPACVGIVIHNLYKSSREMNCDAVNHPKVLNRRSTPRPRIGLARWLRSCRLWLPKNLVGAVIHKLLILNRAFFDNQSAHNELFVGDYLSTILAGAQKRCPGEIPKSPPLGEKTAFRGCLSRNVERRRASIRMVF
jgi:hypothetical protein